MRTLSKGLKGEDVKYLQYLLGITTDSSFGSKTEQAVKIFQLNNKLKSDGMVGSITQKALGLSDFRVHILPKGKYSIWFAGTPYTASSKPTKPLNKWAKEESADYVFNLAFFNSVGNGSDQYGIIKGRTLTYVRGKGYDIGYGGTAEKVTIDKDNICAGYKLGIKDGEAKLVSMIGKRARNANGILKDGTYFQVQSVTTSTEYALVQHMLKNYDVDLLLIQDSGGSSGFYDAKRGGILLAGEREGINGRQVASVVCVKEVK